MRSLLALAPAPTPDENPESNNGALKAQITTGGSYDAHSGNATRIVNDLHVPGGLGTYGLDFTRYWNSVHNDETNLAAEWPVDFGASGWSHSWRWAAVYDEEYPDTGEPGWHIYVTSVTITFPDGHASKFKVTRTDEAIAPWGADPRCGPPFLPDHGETNWPPLGATSHDYLAEMAQDGSQFWLYRADGGSVHFVKPAGWDGHHYEAREVFDPHGFRTTLTYQAGFLTRVEQEGGRWLTIIWGTLSDGMPVILRVETGDNAGSQYVTYYYKKFVGSYALAMVKYANQPAPGQTVSALYAYDSVYPGSLPVLKWADDPHYSGAMTKIAYDYGGGYCPGLSHPPPTPPPSFYDSVNFTPETIAAEKSLETGAEVARFFSACGGERLDYNGLGGVRKLYFGSSANDPQISCPGYMLTKVTDFGFSTGVVPGLPFRRQRGPEPGRAWDGRGIETDFSYADGSGSPSEIRHLVDGSNVSYDRINSGNSAAPDTSRIRNPHHHWLFSKKDENNNVTTYTRDARRRVTRIDYTGGSYEEYSYNEFNQVLTHRMPSGAVQTYQYNALHQLVLEYNSVDGFNERKEYVYDGLGRVEKMRDPRAIADNAEYTVKMEYNGWHQVTKVHYRPAGGGPDPTVTYQYDKYGNCTAIIDELGHRKDYIYDAYRRCTSMTEELNAPGWNGSGTIVSRKWDWIYDRYVDGVPHGASTHTSKEWRVQVEPAFNGAGDRRLSAHKFDCNNRIIEEVTGMIEFANGSWDIGPDTEVHSFTYDENGQKKTYTDPRARVTTYDYDLRNRLWKTNETVNTIPRTTETRYDVAGNKTLVIFPDLQTQKWEGYDAFGQPARFIDERNHTTHLTYRWGPMKKLATVTTHREVDGGWEDQPTTFDYDLMGRPKQTLFPDGSDEFSTYEFGQLKYWKTRKGQTKTINYDARGREYAHTWDDGMTSGVTRAWDDANRLLSMTNNISALDYQYDSGGQVLVEGSTVVGSGGGTNTVRKQLSYCRFPSGEVSQITYPNGSTVVNRFYTARGQLGSVGWGSGATSYVYWPDGKVNYQAFTGTAGASGVTTTYGYNERGMISSVLHKNASNQSLAYREYWRDERDRILAWKRGPSGGPNGMEDGRGDRYRYDAEGQLDRAWYRAQNPETDNPVDPQRGDEFQYDALGNRAGTNRVASRGAMNFERKNNKLNQYRGWWPYSITNYDEDLGGWGEPGEANGVMMQDGWITASFNALNQPMGMWSPMYPGGASAQWMWFGYDPLGRCVKRWVSPLINGQAPPPSTNPATYFYYDGWNLVQEGSSGNVVDRVYVHGGRVDEIVASWAGGQWRHHHYDARGHCIMLTDPSGLIREQYDYDAFGMPYFYNAQGDRLGGINRWGNRFLFTGREWLQDLKVYDYRNRMYQPELGRFLQPDPKEFAAGDYNLYRYCHNDPVNKSDPLGLYDPNSPLTSLGGGDWVRGMDGIPNRDRNLINEARATETSVTGGTYGQRQEARSAIRTILRTHRGQDYTQEMKRRGYGVTTHLTNENDAYADDAPSRHVRIDPSFHPRILTTAGRIPANTTRIIGHEFGHAVMGDRDDGPNRMNNVLRNENPIMRELGQPERLEY